MNNVVNKENLSDILELYSDMVMRIAYQNIKNIAEAEDICQEVFLRLIEKNKIFESQEHIKAYIIRVTINKCRDYLKSGWFRKRVQSKEEQIMNQYGQNNRQENSILESVMELPLKYQNVIYLYYYEGYAVKEISKILHKNEGTIKTWLRRARQQLKAII